MWRSASRRRSRHRRSASSRASGRLNCAQGSLDFGMKAAGHSLDGAAEQSGDRVGLGEGQRGRPIRDREYLGPGLMLRGVPARRGLGLAPERETCFGICPPLDRTPERPGENAERGRYQRPGQNMAALPKPDGAQDQQRQPGQRDHHRQRRLAPIAAKRSGERHERSPRGADLFFGRRSPVAIPSAKARRTASSGAVWPLR